MFLCRLQSTQHYHHQELLPPATDPGDVGPALQSCVVFDFDLILTLISLLSHAELLEGFLSLVDLTRGPHVFTVHSVVCSVRTVGKPQTL